MFHSARLKVERADKHIQELKVMIDAFLDSDYWRFFEKPYNKDGREMIAVCLQVDILPDTFAPVIGDVLHNLRSALDHVWDELIRHFGGIPAKRTNFPTRMHRHEVEAATSNGPVEAVSKPVVDFIVNTVKPYVGGNDVIYPIHNLNAKDKHIALVPVIQPISFKGFSVRNKRTGEIMPYNRLPMLEKIGKSEAIVEFLTPGVHEVAEHGHPISDVVFGEQDFFTHEPVLPTLHRASQVIASTIEDIENAVLNLGT